MPEASIKEHNKAFAPPDDISAVTLIRQNLEIHAVAIAEPMEGAAHRQLCSSPRGSLALHLLPNHRGRGCQSLGHLTAPDLVASLRHASGCEVLSACWPTLCHMTTGEKSSDASACTVKQVRGPFVELPPHPQSVVSETSLKALCRGLRQQEVPLAADLFAGAGGISLGLEKAGYRVVLGVDHYNFAVDTHHAHFAGMSLDWDLADPANVEHIAKLIKDNKVQLLAGGPPCQPFSKAGRSMIRYRVQSGLRDPHDERRDLWRSFLEVVQIAKPPAVVMENVPDMALDREMFIFRSIVEELEQEGYSVHSRVVETWRYGIPQMRQRLIIVALQGRRAFSWPVDARERVTLWNAIGDLPEVEGGWRPAGGALGWADYDAPKTTYQRAMRAGVVVEDANKVFDHITRPVREDDRAAFESMTHKTKYTDLAPEHQRYRKDIFDDKYKKLDENDLSRTITAHIAKDGYWYIHPRQARTLTVREAARIQSFPDDFRFAGPPSAAFKQIGNAVPPIVGEKIGKSVQDALTTRKKVSWTTRDISVKLSDWLRADAAQSGSIPWLVSRDRWKIAVGELLLDRASTGVIRSVWPLIDLQPERSANRLPDEGFATMLYELLSGLGRRSRVDSVVALTDQMRSNPGALWEPTVDRVKLPALSAATADLLELAAPTISNGGESEEPVLMTKGVLRVTSRFFGNDVDKRNRQTDGRLAIARMIGLGPRARDAHLGLIRLAADVCTVEDPCCDRCPLRSECAQATAIL